MTAVDELIAYANTADPFRNAPDRLAQLQMEAVRERFAERRQQIKVLDKRARETGIGSIDTLEDLVPLLFAHTNYKSYPEAFVDNGQWKHMNMWLGTLSTYPTGNIDVSGVNDVDDWMDACHAAGHYIYASSGTSGKSSFLNQTLQDRELCVPACLAAFDLSTRGFKPNHDRSVFTMMPTKGTHKMTEVSTRHFERWAAPGELHRLSNDPIRAMDAMRPAQLRRMLAAGKVGPGEVAAYEDRVAERQARRAVELDAWIDTLADRRHRPIYLGAMWGVLWQLVEALRARGIEDGDFHPEMIISTGGGTKGAKVPPDYREQVLRFFGVTRDRLSNSYAMVEMSGFCALIQPHDVYATPPWLVPLILDKAGEKLLNPADGKGTVEGRMAFFDVLADGRWGGIISGDKVVVEFGAGLDGVKTPIVRSINRYQDLDEGEDKLTCAGSIDSYVRGSITV
ncbi:hypothetical protein [Novosphingobium lentum]|uniref:hypothetical protein n=1 Tax=Novosphingobium lentum TaxID=145287 RepID=UPI00082A677F|nr:hypothetical protein [Novosphingobium lentum]